MTAPRLLLSCVAEDRPRFRQRVDTLVRSARALGGTMADSPIVVNVVESVDPDFARQMRALGVEVRTVPRVTHGGPGANKLRMLEMYERDDFDILLAVDCDIAVAEDPSALISPEAISVVPADEDPLTEEQWAAIFDAVGLEAVERSIKANSTDESIYPYFNSGVIGVPRVLCEELLAEWVRALRDLEILWQRRPALFSASERFFADQLALAVALSRGLPWTVASRELNFGTHIDLHGSAVVGLRPSLLHYHREIDRDGFLFRPRCAAAAPAAERVNRSRAHALGLSYAGLHSRSWSSRMRLTLERRFRRDAWRTDSGQ